MIETPSSTYGSAPGAARARAELVRRIVASSAFSRSARLSDFLRHVYALAEEGRFEEIHEQGIGAAVFGREESYNPGADSIVRSHASRLRHRLKEYFEEEGREEPLILTIPRGSYIPSFEPREGLMLSESAEPEAVTPSVVDGASLSDGSRVVTLLKAALVLALIVILGLTALLLRRGESSRVEDAASRHPFWGAFAGAAGAHLTVVSSDSGLVMYQHLTGNAVTLASYISGEYLKRIGSPAADEVLVRKLGTRRYTPVLDLGVLEHVTGIYDQRHHPLSFHFARDLRLEDLKRGNAILLGSAESNPWVSLFEPSMNFLFRDDLLHDKARILNRHPQPGESAFYDATPEDATPTIYGIVAYRPNLQLHNDVLILEGQTMAGTQTATDFVFDDATFLPFLQKITPKGGRVPHFEILLRSRSLGGQSSQIDVVAYRVEEGRPGG